MKKMNFTGRLIYFDYQQRDCKLDEPPVSAKVNQSSSSIAQRSSYYRSTLSFRHEHDNYKSAKVAPSALNNRSSLVYNRSDDQDLTFNSCHYKSTLHDEYFPFSSLNSHLTDAYRFQAHSLFDSLNAIISLLRSNLIDCRTLRLKSSKKEIVHSNFPFINIFTTRESSANPFLQRIELIGRYSTIHNEYQSCLIDKNKDPSSIQRSLASASRIYYITSLFDEPFLMLRKRTALHIKYTRAQIVLKQLRGRVFDFDELEGYCVDLAEKVCSILNITCRFRIVQDGAFGSQNASTGLWNGMVGEIVSRTADMAIAPLTISQKRMEVVEFSKPFMNLGISIMVGLDSRARKTIDCSR